MLNKNIVMWVILLGALVLCACWHIRENRLLSRQWRKDLDGASARWMERFAWSRSVQMIAVMACAILVIIAYDWQLTDARNQLTTLERFKADTEQRQQLAAKAVPVRPVNIAPATHAIITPAPVASATVPTTPGTYYPPTTVPFQAPTPSALAAATPAAPVVLTPQQPVARATIDDVYNPEKKATDSQSAMDDIKKRYEDILVIYMYLKKCNRVDPNDYRIITSSLAQEMASVNAPGRLQYDILTAAQGTYKELYAQSTCASGDTDKLYAQYQDYIKTLSANAPPP